MNRRTARLTNHRRGTHSRSRRLPAIQSRIRRIPPTSVAPSRDLGGIRGEEAQPAAEQPHLTIEQVVERLEALLGGGRLEQDLPLESGDLDDAAEQVRERRGIV